MDDFIRDQYKAAVAVKSHAKSNALLYVKTVALQKAFGPLYRMWLNVKATMKAIVGIANPFNTAFQVINKTAKVTKAIFTPVLKIFNGLKIAMLFMVGIILSFGAVMLLMAGSVSKAGEQFPVFTDNLHRIKDAAKSVIDRFTELYEYVQSADFAPHADAMKAAFTDAANIISGAIATIMEVLAQVIITITKLDWSPVVNAVKGIGDRLLALGGIILGLDWAGLSSAASDAADSMWEADYSGLSNAISLVTGAISTLAIGISRFNWSGFSSAAFSVFKEILALTNSVLTGGAALFETYLDTVIDVFLTIGDAWVETATIFMDTIAQVLEIAGGLDFSPILAPAMMLFSIFAALVMDFGVGFMTFMGDMFALFGTLMAYLADTGVLQALIDIIGNLGMAAMAIIGAIVYALDEMGINFGSIFGFMSAVISGFITFLMDSGLLAFFVEVIEVVAHLLVVVGFLAAGAIALIGKVLGYLTGPTWQILSGIVGVIVGLLTGAIALVLLPFRLFFKIVSGLVKVFVALLTRGPKAAFGELGKLLGDLGGIVITTFKGVGRSLRSVFKGIIDAVSGGFKLLFSPIQAIIDAVKWVIGKLGGIKDKAVEVVKKIPGYKSAKKVGGAAKKAWGAVFGAKGGIFRGAKKGYRAILHGTEAVVPLPDGKSIPVNLSGAFDSAGIIEAVNALRKEMAHTDTEGSAVTINIAIDGAGKPDDVASAVSRELQKVFRTRARSGGFGRGFF